MRSEHPHPDATARDEALLESLRGLLDAPALEWAEPPRPLGEGAESIVLALTLRNVSDWSEVPLVVRLLQTDNPNQLSREAAVQGALAEAGFAAPRPVATGKGQPGVLEPFLVMERIRGRVMFTLLPALVGCWIVLSIVGLGPLAWALGFAWYATAVVLQRRLHALPVEEIERAVAARGIDPAEMGVTAWLVRIAEQVEGLELGELSAGLTWLRSRMPQERPRVVCHGDYWAGNMMISLRGVTGLIDWGSAAIAPLEFDLGWNLVQDAGDLPPTLGLSEPWRGRLAALLLPVVWLALLPHRWLYRLFQRLDSETLDYFTAFHCMRILVWSYARERETGAPNPWSSDRARALVAKRFQRITGVELTLP